MQDVIISFWSNQIISFLNFIIAFQQWSAPRVSWWGWHRIPWNNIWKAIHLTNKCVYPGEWRWKDYWERNEVSFMVWPHQKFSSLCYLVEPKRFNVRFFILYLLWKSITYYFKLNKVYVKSNDTFEKEKPIYCF